MRRFVLPGLVVLAAAALLGVLAFGVAAQGTSTSIDAQVARGQRPAVPNGHLALPRLGAPGRERLADLRGKVVLVNVFASWCQPCQAEAPLLEREQRYLAAHGGTVLGVTYLDTSTDSERFVRQWHLSYPVIRDIDGTLVRGLGTTGVPESFVIDRRGRVAALRRYQVDSTWLEQTLPAIVGQSS